MDLHALFNAFTRPPSSPDTVMAGSGGLCPSERLRALPAMPSTSVRFVHAPLRRSLQPISRQSQHSQHFLRHSRPRALDPRTAAVEEEKQRLYQMALELARDQNYSTARTMFSHLLNKHPDLCKVRPSICCKRDECLQLAFHVPFPLSCVPDPTPPFPLPAHAPPPSICRPGSAGRRWVHGGMHGAACGCSASDGHAAYHTRAVHGACTYICHAYSSSLCNCLPTVFSCHHPHHNHPCMHPPTRPNPAHLPATTTTPPLPLECRWRSAPGAWATLRAGSAATRCWTKGCATTRRARAWRRWG